MAAVYISISSLQERMTTIKVNDLSAGLTGSPQTTFLTHVIERAQDLIDSFAANLYTVPFSGTIPNIVPEWTYRIAEYELYKRGLGGDVPQKYKDSYKEVYEQLKDMAAGTLKIIGASRNSTVGNSLQFDSDVPLFDEENMDYF